MTISREPRLVITEWVAANALALLESNLRSDGFRANSNLSAQSSFHREISVSICETRAQAGSSQDAVAEDELSVAVAVPGVGGPATGLLCRMLSHSWSRVGVPRSVQPISPGRL